MCAMPLRWLPLRAQGDETRSISLPFDVLVVCGSLDSGNPLTSVKIYSATKVCSMAVCCPSRPDWIQDGPARLPKRENRRRLFDFDAKQHICAVDSPITPASIAKLANWMVFDPARSILLSFFKAMALPTRTTS